MLRKILAGASGLALTLTLTNCTNDESPLASGRETQAVSALTASTTPFAWHFTESFPGTDKVALTRLIPFEGLRDDMILVRRKGERLETMTYLEDEELLDPPSPAFGPEHCDGNPAIANTGTTAQTNNIVILVKSASGVLQLGKRGPWGDWTVLATFGSGLATGNFGNPAMAYNPVGNKLEVVYREGGSIRHWSGTRNSDGTFAFKNNGLIPGTGGAGTKVISALGIAVKADGKAVVVARRSEKNLRYWYATSAVAPYCWKTGPAFGALEESSQAPSVAAHGDGTLQVVAVGKKNGTTPELLQYQIGNLGSTPAFLSVIKGSDHLGPVSSTGHSHPSVAAMDSKTLVTVTAYKSGSIIGVGIR